MVRLGGCSARRRRANRRRQVELAATMSPETAYGILVLIGLLSFGAITAKIASDKGGSATLWFIAGALLPLIALLLAIFLSSESVNSRAFKKCPKCAESVRREALICRFCNYEFGAGDDWRVV